MMQIKDIPSQEIAKSEYESRFQDLLRKTTNPTVHDFGAVCDLACDQKEDYVDKIDGIPHHNKPGHWDHCSNLFDLRNGFADATSPDRLVFLPLFHRPDRLNRKLLSILCFQYQR